MTVQESSGTRVAVLMLTIDLFSLLVLRMFEKIMALLYIFFRPYVNCLQVCYKCSYMPYNLTVNVLISFFLALHLINANNYFTGTYRGLFRLLSLVVKHHLQKVSNDIQAERNLFFKGTRQTPNNMLEVGRREHE